jgi:hypothetical protein
MAERRMFAKTIVDSDAFLDMPLSSQALYFHLSMRADDDGFVNNPKKIQRMIGCSDDDLKLLIAKRFVLIFDSGVIVIKHWRLHNTLRKDRYKPTIYQEEFKKLILKSDGGYTDRLPSGCQVVANRLPSGCQADDKEETAKNDESKDINELDVGCQSGNQVATQDRLGKDRLIINTNQKQTEICNEEPAREDDVCSENFDDPLIEQAENLAAEQTQKVVDDPDAVVTPVQVIGLARFHGIKVARTIKLEQVCKQQKLTVDNVRQCIRIAKKEQKGGPYLVGILANAVNEPNEYHTWEYQEQKRKEWQEGVDENVPF